MSKGVINSITLDKTVILGSGSAKVTVDYTASGSDTFTLDDFVDPPSYLSLDPSSDLSLVHQKILTGSTNDSYDRYGYSVAIDGDYAIVGAKNEDSDKGAAYIFKKNGTNWEQKQKLIFDDADADDHIGISVAISGHYAIVGAYGKEGDPADPDTTARKGAAYIFYNDFSAVDAATGLHSGWWGQQGDKLTANDGSAKDQFGYSVAISGNYAIVGARKEGATNDGIVANHNNNSGSAYIFKRDGSNWAQQAKLTAKRDNGESDADAGDEFGRSVAIDGDYAIVGAQYHDRGEGPTYYPYTDAGAAYIFKKDNGAETWTIQKRLTAEGYIHEYDNFGRSVAISGDYIIVGTPCHDPQGKGANAGSAYIFKKADNAETWTLTEKLTASDGASSDNFGYSVAISGNYAIVGAPYNAEPSTGSAYIFKRDGSNWAQQAKLTANYGAEELGWSVAISGDYAIVGAPNDTHEVYTGLRENAGAAYIYGIYGSVFRYEPPVNTISLKKLEIKTNNWTGVTKSDYFLINTYSGQGSGIMNTLYNNTLNYTQVNYTRGYDDEYPVGSGVGYLTGYAAGSGDGYVAGSGAGYTNGFNDSYEAEDARLNTKNVVVHPGWNIFSPVKNGIINDTDNVIIPNSLHMFNGTSYEKKNENNIEKGKGYMVKCEGSGSFTIDYS